ncbi:hypothetical protein B0E48_13140 [Rhodanobacter sp. C03]|nr:hypothetical protein B0E48_13140 [Rhodanobacter sp. C03]
MIEQVRSDWADLEVSAHKISLIADAHSSNATGVAYPALIRLRFYYPDQYGILKRGSLIEQIAHFESDEKKLQ